MLNWEGRQVADEKTVHNSNCQMTPFLDKQNRFFWIFFEKSEKGRVWKPASVNLGYLGYLGRFSAGLGLNIEPGSLAIQPDQSCKCLEIVACFGLN